MSISATFTVATPIFSATSGGNLTATQMITYALTGDGASTSFVQNIFVPGVANFGMGLPSGVTATITKQQTSGLPGSWKQNHAYATNFIIGASNGTLQEATTAGTSFGTTWAPNTNYILNQYAFDPYGNLQQCITPGLSGTSIPSNFITNMGANTQTQDNTVVWNCIGNVYPSFSSTLNATTAEVGGTALVWTCEGPNNVTVGYDVPSIAPTLNGNQLTLTFGEALKAPGAQVTDAYGNTFTYTTWAVSVTLSYNGGSSTNALSTSWTSATAANTVLTLPLNGVATSIVSIVSTGTITAGVLAFQVSPDNANWFTVYGILPASFQPIGGWNLNSGSNGLTFNVAGFAYFRVVLSTAITGTGTAVISVLGTSVVVPTVAVAGLAATYGTAPPSPTNGNSAPLQIAPNASLIVQPYRRSQIVAATGSIAATAAATMLAAQGAGVFADLAVLVLTLGAESAAAYITVNISDGTNTYKFGFAAEAVGTAGAGSAPIDICFDPPLPATTANVAWTIALSVADATIFYVAEFVKQTANF